MSTEILEAFDEATAKIETIIWIAASLGGGESIADALDEFLDEASADILDANLGMPAYVHDALDNRHERGEIFAEWAVRAGRLGFLIQVRTPVMKPRSETCRDYSWGYTTSKWFYDDDLNLAVQKALGWVDSRRAAEMEKFKQGGEG